MLSKLLIHRDLVHLPPASDTGDAETSNDGNTITVIVPGNVAWVNSGIIVSAGQSFHITASGSMNPCVGNPACTYGGPAGIPSGRTPAEIGANPGEVEIPNWASFPMPYAVTASLIGRIGSNAPFYVGTGGVFTANSDGMLQLGINGLNLENNAGSFSVSIEVLY